MIHWVTDHEEQGDDGGAEDDTSGYSYELPHLLNSSTTSLRVRTPSRCSSSTPSSIFIFTLIDSFYCMFRNIQHTPREPLLIFHTWGM